MAINQRKLLVAFVGCCLLISGTAWGQAKPPEVVEVARRALRILEPAVELPAMQEVFLVEAGEWSGGPFTKTGSIAKYGDYLSIPSSTKKYDVVWVPAVGQGVYLMRNFMLPERKVVDVKPETILGMVKVSGSGQAQVFAMPTGAKPVGPYRPTNKVENFGDILALPAGKYDVYVSREANGTSQDTLLEEGLEVQPGKLVQLQ